MEDEQDTTTEGISYWDHYSKYPLEDWQYEVANGDTRRGYHEWVAAKREEDDTE